MVVSATEDESANCTSAMTLHVKLIGSISTLLAVLENFGSEGDYRKKPPSRSSGFAGLNGRQKRGGEHRRCWLKVSADLKMQWVLELFANAIKFTRNSRRTNNVGVWRGPGTVARR